MAKKDREFTDNEKAIAQLGINEGELRKQAEIDKLARKLAVIEKSYSRVAIINECLLKNRKYSLSTKRIISNLHAANRALRDEIWRLDLVDPLLYGSHTVRINVRYLRGILNGIKRNNPGLHKILLNIAEEQFPGRKIEDIDNE